MKSISKPSQDPYGRRFAAIEGSGSEDMIQFASVIRGEGLNNASRGEFEGPNCANRRVEVAVEETAYLLRFIELYKAGKEDGRAIKERRTGKREALRGKR